jgi:ABC-type multidrug transport system ATPase subunit
MSGVLGARGLVLDYGHRSALRGVDLRVEPGEILA